MNIKQANISDLGTREKIGQVVMPRLDFREPDPLPLVKRLISEYGAGGFIVFGGDKKSVKNAVEELSSISDVPLLFGLDAERGVGQIISDAVRFPFTMSLGAIGEEALVYEEARFIAEEMKECGLNLIFAPVLDVNTDPDNPIINIRSYGDDPGLVSRLGAAFIRGAQDGGVLACGKHFPGHGDTGADSHEVMPVQYTTLRELESSGLVPFRRAVREDAAAFMTAHVAFPRVSNGNIPATISGDIVDGILRRGLAYNGLVITDSFHMSGINRMGEEWDNAHLALEAGCDIILDPRDPVTLLSRLFDMASTGELNMNTLDRSVSRIVSAKNMRLTKPPAGSPVRSQNGTRIIERISEGSICRLKGGKLRSRKALVFVFDVTRSDGDIAGPFTESLGSAGIDFKAVHVTYTTQLDELIARSREYDALICLIYTTVGAWKKQSALPEFFRSALDEIAALPADKALISLGSPYVVRGFDRFDTVICAFDSMSECQSSAARVLLGDLEARGRMPVDTGF
ncbi:MAG: glycoside hydrolase family 3 N-terminal domain-containing protein [Thermodesulfobacteriota bacterium]